MNRAQPLVIPAQAGIHPAHPCILKILMQTKTYPYEDAPAPRWRYWNVTPAILSPIWIARTTSSPAVILPI